MWLVVFSLPITMAVYRAMSAALLLVVLLLGLTAPTTLAQGRRGRGRDAAPAGLTLEYIYGRMRNLERKLSRTQQEVSRAQEQIKAVEGRIGQGGGGSTNAVQGQKFTDLSACPIRAQGFYYAPKFKSCYRLEPSDTLVNQTEAARICRMLAPRSELVSIESAEEQEFLRTRWHEERGIGSLVRYWTSGRRNGLNWQWEGSDSPISYSNWIPSTEHNDDRFSCMAVYSNEAYTWIDVACWAPHLVTCEVNLA